MKKIVLPILFAAFALTSCQLFNEPDARFSASKNQGVKLYEVVEFYNHSRYANEYEWSFGDGAVSYESNPVHYYSQPGIYDVVLRAYKDDQMSEAVMTIEVIAPDLDIQVLEFYNKYVVPNAKVILYPTLADWDAQTNKVTFDYTDADGIVRFYNLPDGFYYLDISNNTHDNYTLANEDVGFIKTPYIGGYTTTFTAYVDYVGAGMKSTKTGKRLIPVTNKRVFKPEMAER